MRIGRIGEQFAKQYMERSLGWRIECSNWRCPAGELDVVASHENTLIVVEVRTKTSTAFGTPADAVDARKVRQLLRVIPYLLHHLRWTEQKGQVRLDAIALLMSEQLVREMVHVQDVFTDSVSFSI
jgi:putative endonuclease